MATKKQTLQDLLEGKGCLAKAADDEEIFILRGRDLHAADLVEKWATWASVHMDKQDKATEAYACAERMRLTPGRRLPD